MKHILWLVVLFVLIPVSMIVANPYQEKPTMGFAIQIPHEIIREYLQNEDPEKCLIPLEIIPLGHGEVGIVPFVTVAERRQIVETGKYPEGLTIKVEALICLCKNHKGNRLVMMRALDENGNERLIWTNPEILKNKERENEQTRI